MKKYKIAIVGATGAVGQQCLKWLYKLNFPFESISAFASNKSAGRLIRYQNFVYTVQELNKESFNDIDICFFCTNEEVSKKYVPIALKKGCLVIDNSSFYRLNDDIPLVIPEINMDTIKTHRLIANPNCATSILCTALKPLDDLYSINKVIVSTYQSVSGIGFKAIQDLKLQTRADLDGINYNSPYFPTLSSPVKYHMAFNCLPQIGTFNSLGISSEEEKIIAETQKILNKKIAIVPTCVRVPTISCHCESVYVEFDYEIDLNQIYKKLKKMKHLKVYNKILPINSNCANQLEVFISRLRKVNDHSLSFYVVSDNLLKGAASNAIKIALAAIQDK